MKLLVDGKEVPLLKMVVKESIFDLYGTIEAEVLGALPQSVVIEDESKINYQVVDSRLGNTSYVYTLVSSEVFKVLNSKSNSFTGDASVKTLLNQKLGFKANLRDDSAVSHWSIPQMRPTKILGILNNYTKTQNGGGVHFYINVDGIVNCVDLGKAFKLGAPKELKCQVVSDSSDIKWIKNTPGEFEVFYHNVNGPAQKSVSLVKGYGKGTLVESFNTEFGLDMEIQRISNVFFTNYYTARTLVVIFPDVASFQLGDLYDINSTGVIAVLTGVVVERTPSDKVPIKTTLTLHTCLK